MRDTPTKSMPPAENFPNGNLTVKEGELDVEAKVKECCSNTRNLSVAAHQPTRVVAESLKVRTLDYNEPRRAYVCIYSGSSKHDWQFNLPHVFNEIHGSCLSINKNNVAVLFYGSRYRNPNLKQDQLLVRKWRTEGSRVYSKECTSYDRISLASDTWLVAGLAGSSGNEPTTEYRFALLNLDTKKETRFQLVPQDYEGPHGHFCEIDSKESASSSTPDVTITALIQRHPGGGECHASASGIPAFQISVPLSKLVDFAESDRKEIEWKEWKDLANVTSPPGPNYQDYFVSGYGRVSHPPVN